MRTPYIPHLFGVDAVAKTHNHSGWVTAGVVSSIPWPESDVWVCYDGAEYYFHGITQGSEPRNSPCISTHFYGNDVDLALSKIYRFASILGYFKRGYVDITGSVWGPRIIRYEARDSFTSLMQAGIKSFSCNHMPIVDDDQVRKALAFLREGRRLRRVHEPYSFLSFFKVIESQLSSEDRRAWVEKSLDSLEGEAAARVAALRNAGINVSEHLYKSGRCAVAHASLGGNIVDPDIPADRKRIAEDIGIISSLADHYIKVEAGVPDEMDLYRSRDRLIPWHSLMGQKSVIALMAGGQVEKTEELGRLNGAKVSVRLWPDPPPEQFQAMTLLPQQSRRGVVKLVALNLRKTIALVFAMDVAHGRMHILLDEGSIDTGVDVTEQDVEDYTRYFHSVIGNRVVELSIEGAEPVTCEVVIPHNIIPQSPEKAVADALAEFRRRNL